MPTRFYLPSVGDIAFAPGPTVSADWEHVNGVRRPMSTTNGGTTLATQAYTPDAADHLVNGDAHHVQFSSPPLAAQTISAQTVTLTVQALEANAGNNLFVTWKLFVWTAAGSVGSTILAIRRDPTNEVATGATNRTDAATTTSVSVGDGDRIVLELGLGGTPTAAGGTQGHNGSLRLGESGLTDAPANDTSTSTTENPWLEFANVLTFPEPPATTATVALTETASLAVAGVKAAASAPSVRAIASATTVTEAFVPDPGRRALVTWAQLSVPVRSGPAAVLVALRARVRLAAAVAPSRSATGTLRGRSRSAAATAKASSTAVTLRGGARSVATSVRTSSATARIWAAVRAAPAPTTTRTTTVAARAGVRATADGVAEVGHAAAATARARAWIAAAAEHAAAVLAVVRSTGRGRATVAKNSQTTVTLRAGGRSASVSAAPPVATAATIAARARATATSTTTRATSTSVTFGAASRQTVAVVRGSQAAVELGVSGRLAGVAGATTRSAAVQARATGSALALGRAASYAVAALHGDGRLGVRIGIQQVPGVVGARAVPTARLGTAVVPVVLVGAARVPASAAGAGVVETATIGTARAPTARLTVVTTPHDPEG